MANYGLYSKIEPSNITSALESLEKDVNSTKTDLNTLKTGLTDSVWKANSKNTLISAFDKINGEVCDDINKYISNLKTIASYITNYKSAEASANEYQEKISKATEKTPQSTISEWNRLKAECEKTMTECENKINSLK